MISPPFEPAETRAATPALPTLFVGHGAPTIVLEQDPLAEVLARLARQLPRPTAVLAVSAHWESETPAVSASERPETIHDFYGFPATLHELRYPAPGAPALARRVAELSGAALNPERGLDHGAWVPLMMLYPAADIPVVQLAVCPARGFAWHWALGKRLRSLRAQGVLILASGGVVHNLRRLAWHAPRGQALPWAAMFEDTIHGALIAGDRETLQDPWRLPHGHAAVPAADHYLPLLVAAGAAEGEPVSCLHRDWHYGSLAIHGYAFGLEATPAERR